MLVWRVWSGDNQLVSWLDATLYLLYKGGKDRGPSSHLVQGILLISGAVKVLSLVVLRRMAEQLHQRMQQQRIGFERSKSCQGAYAVVERSDRCGNGFIISCLSIKSTLVFDFVDRQGVRFYPPVNGPAGTRGPMYAEADRRGGQATV